MRSKRTEKVRSVRCCSFERYLYLFSLFFTDWWAETNLQCSGKHIASVTTVWYSPNFIQEAALKQVVFDNFSVQSQRATSLRCIFLPVFFPKESIFHFFTTCPGQASSQGSKPLPMSEWFHDSHSFVLVFVRLENRSPQISDKFLPNIEASQ